MITMAEIARLTHVSQATVSRVLNGIKTVAPEIRERVLACAQEHDYQPSALAKGLRGDRTHLLGVLLTDISNSFFADLAREIEDRARTYGYSIILFNTDQNCWKQREYLDVLRRYRVDGILMVPSLDDPVLWKECTAKMIFPTVMVTWRVKGFDCVHLDHSEATSMVAFHLVERGYRRFLFVGEATDFKYGKFTAALQKLGFAPEEMGCLTMERNGNFRDELRAWVRRGEARTGIFASNDMQAMRVLQVLRDLEISVPEEVGVIGFDDSVMSRYLRPSLSTISQPIGEIAEKAVDRLLYRIEHPDEPELLDLIFHGQLIHREST